MSKLEPPAENTASAPIANVDQIDYWNGEVGSRWARLQDRLDALFVGLTEEVIGRAAPAPGERVLDIGCGCGATVLALASRVGDGGRVTGVDISAPMLERARQRIAAGHVVQADVTLADAATHPFERFSVDLVFSRFGVMFFDAPAQAFANIARALRPGGRLVFACWRPYKDNPFFSAAHRAAKPHLPEAEEQTLPPGAPGPFSLDDPERVRQILGEAGLRDIAITPHDVPMRAAASGEIEEATDLIVQIGPVARAMASGDAAQQQAARQAVHAALADYDGPDGIELPARLWFVEAVAPSR